jgi:hypothetical protein
MTKTTILVTTHKYYGFILFYYNIMSMVDEYNNIGFSN